VVDKLNGGVTALLKRAKTRVIFGWGTFSDAKTANFIMTMETVAGGVRAGHDMAFERLDTNVGVALTLTQALRAYADPGDETLCFGSGNFSSGPYVGVQVSFSGQLIPLQ